VTQEILTTHPRRLSASLQKPSERNVAHVEQRPEGQDHQVTSSRHRLQPVPLTKASTADHRLKYRAGIKADTSDSGGEYC